MFIPTTREEMTALNWDRLDIIIISGDTYIDSYYNGAAIIGKVLIDKGYRVGIIAQPDVGGSDDITRLGEPELFWGITSGSVESMVANYTAHRKKRNNDDLTPGLSNNRRPDRALIAYSNLIRRNFKNTVPIVLGGIEASLRRIAHYDYWSNNIRRSILFDAKADIIVYGMGEKTILQLAEAFKNNTDYVHIRGICYKADTKIDEYIELPDFDAVKSNHDDFITMFNIFYSNHDYQTANGLQQKHSDKYLIQTPPQVALTTDELDEIYSMKFERDVHPYYKKQGEVRALTTIKFSITTHRGCFGECNFCAITVHQGKKIVSRSISSIINEIKELVRHKDFKGIISDLGGPTANMYGMNCRHGFKCKNKRCLSKHICKNLSISHKKQLHLLKKARGIKGVKKIFISSGIRYDLLLYDGECFDEYLDNLVLHHVSGQLKIAPEHSDKEILTLMGKPGIESLLKFKKAFEKLNKKYHKKQFLTYYFIAAHPGCEQKHMLKLKNFIETQLKLKPEQIQVFTPTPSTYSTLMYYTGKNPFTNKKVYVEKEVSKKIKQKNSILTVFKHKMKKYKK